MEASVETTSRQASVGSTLHYDPSNNTFLSSEAGDRLDHAGIEAFAGFDPRKEGTGGPGHTTLQRDAIFRALLSGGDARRSFLASIRGIQGGRGQGYGGETEGSFGISMATSNHPSSMATSNHPSNQQQATDLTRSPSPRADTSPTSDLLTQSEIESLKQETKRSKIKIREILAREETMAA